MNRLCEQLKVIPRTGWVIALLIYMGFAIGAGFIGWGNAPFGLWGYGIAVIAAPLIPAVYVLLVSYIYGDASRRGMRAVPWTLLAIFIPSALGIILYFLLRRDFCDLCPNCGEAAGPGFSFCPYCGSSIKRKCPQCRHPVDSEWFNCPHCGTVLVRSAPTAEQQKAHL